MSHDALADRLWYVRRRGQVLGPFSVAELTKLRDRGNLAAFDEVSEDRASWIRFERLAEVLNPKPVEEPAAVSPAAGGFVAVPSFAPRDFRSTSLGLALLWIGHLLEMLAGLCLVILMIVVLVQGKPTVASVTFFLWTGLSIGFQILHCIGYGLASGGSSDAGPKTLPVTSLIMQIVDFLLVVILLVLMMISGSVAGLFRTDETMGVAVALLFGARALLWIPMTIVLIEWLKGLAGRVEKGDATARSYSRNVLAQSSYVYVLYIMQNLALALAFLVYVLFDAGLDVLQRLNDKVALTFVIISVMYLMLATVVGIWRIALLFMSWRSLREGRSSDGYRGANLAGTHTAAYAGPELAPPNALRRAVPPGPRPAGTKPHDPGFEVVADTPKGFTSSPSFKYILLGAAFLIATTTTVLAIFFLTRDRAEAAGKGGGNAQAAAAPQRAPSKGVIASDSDEKIVDAVGLVACVAQIKKGNANIPWGSSGSSFSITSDGYLLTNKHVIDPREDKRFRDNVTDVSILELSVFLNSAEYPAEVVFKSEAFDLAILKIKRREGPYFKLNGSNKELRGLRATATGFPGIAREPLSDEEGARGLARMQNASKLADIFKKSDFDYSLTRGEISRLKDEDVIPPRNWVEHRAFIHGGNSGGPLFLENGVVVGINTLRRKDGDGFFASLSLPQLRQEIDKHVKGVHWD